MSFNKIIIEGRLTRDPEWKSVGNGLCKFSVAVNESWKDDAGEWQESVDYFDVSLWGESGKYQAEKLFKGAQVIVSGKMKSRKHDGTVYWEIKPEFGGIKLLNPKANGAEVGRAVPAASVDDDDDTLPF